MTIWYASSDVWDEPRQVMGIASRKSVFVGKEKVADDLDGITNTIYGIKDIVENHKPEEKLEVLEALKHQVIEKKWWLPEYTKEETIEHLELLIEFCRRAVEKHCSIKTY